MAEIPGTKQALGQGTIRVTWSGLAASDTGAPVQIAGATDVVVQAIGDATAVPIEGSNDGTTFAPVHNPIDGAAVILDASTAANSIETVLDATLAMRVAAVTGGTDTDVILIAKVRS